MWSVGSCTVIIQEKDTLALYLLEKTFYNYHKQITFEPQQPSGDQVPKEHC